MGRFFSFFLHPPKLYFLLMNPLNSPISLNVCMLILFSHVQLFVTLWTVAHQAPLSMGFSRHEYWSGLPCPPPGDLPDPGIKPTSFMFPALAGGFFTTSTTWEALSSPTNPPLPHTENLNLTSLGVASPQNTQATLSPSVPAPQAHPRLGSSTWCWETPPLAKCLRCCPLVCLGPLGASSQAGTRQREGRG